MTSSRPSLTRLAESLIPPPVAYGSTQAAIAYDPAQDVVGFIPDALISDLRRSTRILLKSAHAQAVKGWPELGSLSAFSAIPMETVRSGGITTMDVFGGRLELDCEPVIRLDDLHLRQIVADYLGVFGNFIDPIVRSASEDAGNVERDGARDRLIARFRLLRHLPNNHDNEGASVPNLGSVDAAIAFISSVTTSTPASASLNDAGAAVIEFEDRSTGLFADVTFLPSGRVEVYRRKPGVDSVRFEDELSAKRTREFLAQEVDVVY
jgi:hypothetical protein